MNIAGKKIGLSTQVFSAMILGAVFGLLQDMRAQQTVLALPAMIEHHAVFVVQRSDEYHGIRPSGSRLILPNSPGCTLQV